MTAQTVLWIYIVLLVAGGLAGFLKARSKASLITSAAFAAALALCALGILAIPWLADALILVLLLFFGWRFAKGRRFMPGGLMAILSALTLVLRQVL